MKKTIIALALAIVIISVLLCACKSKKGDGETSTTTETTTIEVFTDAENGEMYVTNINGDKIPVTTDVDGAFDFLDELVTKTLEQVSAETEVIESKKQDAATSTTRASIPETTQSSVPATTESAGVEVGNGDIFDEDHAAIIDWG